MGSRVVTEIELACGEGGYAMTVTRACGGKQEEGGKTKTAAKKSPVRRTVGARQAPEQTELSVESAEKKSQLAVVRELIKNFMSDIRNGTSVKGTVGDLLRLMQLEKELAPPQDHEVVVRWVDPEE